MKSAAAALALSPSEIRRLHEEGRIGDDSPLLALAKAGRRAASRGAPEHEAQAAVFEWIARHVGHTVDHPAAGLVVTRHTDDPLLLPLLDLYAIPNFIGRHGASRTARATQKEMARLRREGLRPGMPDLHLPHARVVQNFSAARVADRVRRVHSLYVELKIGGNRASRVQQERHAALRAAGNAVVVVRDPVPATLAQKVLDTLRSYLRDELTIET